MLGADRDKKKKPCGDRQRLREGAVGQGGPRIDGPLQKQGRGKEESTQSLGAGMDQLTPSFWSCRSRGNKFLSFKATSQWNVITAALEHEHTSPT